MQSLQPYSPQLRQQQQQQQQKQQQQEQQQQQQIFTQSAANQSLSLETEQLRMRVAYYQELQKAQNATIRKLQEKLKMYKKRAEDLEHAATRGEALGPSLSLRGYSDGQLHTHHLHAPGDCIPRAVHEEIVSTRMESLHDRMYKEVCALVRSFEAETLAHYSRLLEEHKSRLAESVSETFAELRSLREQSARLEDSNRRLSASHDSAQRRASAAGAAAQQAQDALRSTAASLRRTFLDARSEVARTLARQGDELSVIKARMVNAMREVGAGELRAEVARQKELALGLQAALAEQQAQHQSVAHQYHTLRTGFQQAVEDARREEAAHGQEALRRWKSHLQGVIQQFVEQSLEQQRAYHAFFQDSQGRTHTSTFPDILVRLGAAIKREVAEEVRWPALSHLNSSRPNLTSHISRRLLCPWRAARFRISFGS
jgi:hypothetical protein